MKLKVIVDENSNIVAIARVDQMKDDAGRSFKVDISPASPTHTTLK